MNRTQILGLAAGLLLGQSAAAQPAPGAAVAAPPSVAHPEPNQDTPELKAQKREAAKRMLALMRPVWNEEQIGRIMFIGWYSGAAALCDELEIDDTKLAAAIAGLSPKDLATLPPERARFLADNLMLHVGMATGWVIAGHLRDIPKFCADAVQAKAEMPADKHLFAMSDDDKPVPKP
jgi:hypothetical protein